jgi:hypothetical protein
MRTLVALLLALGARVTYAASLFVEPYRGATPVSITVIS